MNSLTTIRPELLTLTEQQLRALGPFLWVFGGALLTIILSVTKLIPAKWSVFFVTILTAVAGITSAACLSTQEPLELFNRMMVVDSFTCFFTVVFLASAALTAFASLKYLDSESLQYPEYYVLMHF